MHILEYSRHGTICRSSKISIHKSLRKANCSEQYDQQSHVLLDQNGGFDLHRGQYYSVTTQVQFGWVPFGSTKLSCCLNLGLDLQFSSGLGGNFGLDFSQVRKS